MTNSARALALPSQPAAHRSAESTSMLGVVSPSLKTPRPKSHRSPPERSQRLSRPLPADAFCRRQKLPAAADAGPAGKSISVDLFMIPRLQRPNPRRDVALDRLIRIVSVGLVRLERVLNDELVVDEQPRRTPRPQQQPLLAAGPAQHSHAPTAQTDSTGHRSRHGCCTSSAAPQTPVLAA